jgi:hypothetical protein
LGAGTGSSRAVHRGIMDAAALAVFVRDAQTAGWKPPRKGKVASLRKQLPGFEAACAALDRGTMSKLGDQLTAALAPSPAVSPPQDAPALTGRQTERAMNDALAKRVAAQPSTDSPGAPLGDLRGTGTPPISPAAGAAKAAGEQPAEAVGEQPALAVGMVIGALYAPPTKGRKRGRERGQWFRARVTRVLPSGGADVAWMDDGTAGTVTADQIWILDPAQREAAENGTLDAFYAAEAEVEAAAEAAAEAEAVAEAVAGVRSGRGAAKRARAAIAWEAKRHGFTKVPRSQYGGTTVVAGTTQSCLADAVFVCLKDLGAEVTRQECWGIIGDPAEGATVDAAVAFALGHGVTMKDLGRGFHSNPLRALEQPGVSISLLTLEDEAGATAAHAIAKVHECVVDNAGDVRRVDRGDMKTNKVALGVFKDIYTEWPQVSIDRVFSLELE